MWVYTALYGLCLPRMSRFVPPENVSVCASQQKISQKKNPNYYQIIISSIIIHIPLTRSYPHDETIKRFTIDIHKSVYEKINHKNNNFTPFICIFTEFNNIQIYQIIQIYQPRLVRSTHANLPQSKSPEEHD